MTIIDMWVEEYTTAYEEGKAARESDNPEPMCTYEPGTEKYRLFAEGFCEKGF